MLRFCKLFKCLTAGGGRAEIAAPRSKVTAAPYLSVSEEVRCALTSGNPVVALESTIVTHGMPFPRNAECALDVEAEVRAKGAVPATIAILEGRVKVGLTRGEILALADPNTEAVKTSRRDVAYVVANRLNGGTTVSATLIIAAKLDIPIFATGGIGGVHRFGEKTLDVSADLTELGRTSVAVVCSGVKSILDIPRTLEYLETQGVFVAAYGETKEFPAFYCRKSGSDAPYNVRNAREAASVIRANRLMNLKSGMVFAVPAPSGACALDEEQMKNAIDEALTRADARGIRGKEITPFLLARVSEITGGKSLETNIALVKNNARVAAEIAVELSGGAPKIPAREKAPPVVIGGSVLDRCVNVREPEIKLDGRIHAGKCTESPGGVARNIADALRKLHSPPAFISAVGDDGAGKFLSSGLSMENVRTSPGSTAQCVVIFDAEGECKFLVGDMEAHERITPELIRSKEDLIGDAPIVVMDGNCPLETMERILEISARHNVPVFFEPTDVDAAVSRKPFATSHWKAIKYVSPNVTELRHIAKELGIHSGSQIEVEEVARIASRVANYIENVIVTLGSRGLLMVRRAGASEPLLNSTGTFGGDVQIRHYPVGNASDVINVSGAGDCLVAGLVAAMLEGRSEENCVSVGMAAAIASLRSASAVPEALFDKQHESWHSNAFYTVLNL